MLDPAFAGAFTRADLELKSEIDRFVSELVQDPSACSAEAFEEIRQMLKSLGLPDADNLPEKGEDASARSAAPPTAEWVAVEDYSI